MLLHTESFVTNIAHEFNFLSARVLRRFVYLQVGNTGESFVTFATAKNAKVPPEMDN
jgi:hypothetical protein